MDQLVTSHEIGHNWGSGHDTDDSDTSCRGDTINGRYLMYPVAVDGSIERNKQFSTCSRSNITKVLQVKGTCFSTSPSGFCGDYIVQAANSETCDAGVAGDKCCFGNNAAQPCKLNASAVCSDSSSVCCTNCLASPNTKVCFAGFDNDPQCRATKKCDGSTFSCGSPGPKVYGEPCGNAGFCSGVSATSAACIPLCARFGASSCKCTGADECRVCCKHDPNVTSTCGTPFAAYGSPGAYTCTRASVALASVTNTTCLRQPYWTSTLGTPILYNATQKDPACTSGTCWGILDYVPNTACSLGACDASATCVAQTVATAPSPWDLSSFSLSNAQKWMRENIVGSVLLFSFVFWLPIGCLVNRYDKKQRAKNASYGMRQGATMTFRPKSDPRAGANRQMRR